MWTDQSSHFDCCRAESVTQQRAMAISIHVAFISIRATRCSSWLWRRIISFLFIYKLNTRLLSILDEHEVDQETPNLMGDFGATAPGLFAAVPGDKKDIKTKFLKDVMSLAPTTEPEKALRARICSRVATLTRVWLTADVLDAKRSRSESSGRPSSHFPTPADARARPADNPQGLREAGDQAHRRGRTLIGLLKAQGRRS